MLKEFKNKSIITKIFIILNPILIIAIVCVGIMLFKEYKIENINEETSKEKNDKQVAVGEISEGILEDIENDDKRYLFKDNDADIDNSYQEDSEKEYVSVYENQKSKENFLNSLTENDTNTFKNLAFFKTGFSDQENFISDRFDIVGSDIIYSYNYVFMGNVTGTELRCFMVQLTPICTVPASWRTMRTIDLQYNFIVKEIKNGPASIRFSVATGVTDSEEAEVIAQMQTKIDEKIQEFRNKLSQKVLKIDLDKIGKKYFEYAIKYDYDISKNIKSFSNISSDNENFKNKYNSLKDELLDQKKALCIKYYKKVNKSSNYKISSYNEYFAVATLVDIDVNKLPLNYDKFDISELISVGCIEDTSNKNVFMTDIVTGNDEDKESIIEQQYKLVCSHFGI